LLAAAGWLFDVVPADVDERPLPGEHPADYVLRVADAKAEHVARRHSGRVVIAADTVVVVGGEMLGKPEDSDAARRMLRLLAGKAHDVLTGVSVYRDRRIDRAVEASRVHVAELTDSEIDWYVATGEPYDKAGAYAVQGLASRFVDRIEGSYSNVVGLPVARLYRLLVNAGLIQTQDAAQIIDPSRQGRYP
jgi:septum formation protein